MNDSESRQKIGEKGVYPVVIFPFSLPSKSDNLEKLYSYLSDHDGMNMHKILTVVPKQTSKKLEFNKKYKDLIKKFSDIEFAWSVDSCQMWLTGLGKAYENSKPSDIFWLIPGDFNYNTDAGDVFLSNMAMLPKKEKETVSGLYFSQRKKQCQVFTFHSGQ